LARVFAFNRRGAFVFWLADLRRDWTFLRALAMASSGVVFCVDWITMAEAMEDPKSAIRIFVDADACPVKPEIYRVAERYGLKVYVVANAFMAVPRTT
jgi:hypothetical protein